MAKAKTKIVESEKAHIAKFLHAMTEKNYAEANKYLQAAINQKIVGSIRDTQQG
tara:strand:- start:379 stop:540 length:162 start_codon:yes stop_codon:yes gene_type:complete